MKKCLIIDDNNQDDEKNLLEKYSREHQFPITCHIFNPTKRECSRMDKKADGTFEEVIDVDLLLGELRMQYEKEQFDLIAIDYNLSDPYNTGLDIIRFLKENNWKRKVPYVIYSGEDDKIKQKLQESIHQVKDDADELKNFIENYLATNPIKIYNRGKKQEVEDGLDGSYIYRLYEFLKGNKTPMEAKLSQKMAVHKNRIFENIFPDFEGQKVGVLAELVLDDSERSDRFKDEFIDRCIDFFILLKN